jgi:tetratricopeptide (TPR) repeat protein
MTSNQNNNRLPVKQGQSDFQVQPETTAQAVMGFLPKTESIDADDKIEIAREEGYDPMAVKLALAPPASSASDKIRLLFMITGAVILVIVFFPLHRFFKPAPKDLGTMTIGGPILEDSLTPSNIRNKPWLKVLVEIDRLYFQEGKLSEAIQVAESALQKLPDKEREAWHQLYYRYWELLLDADRVQVLQTSTRAYLKAFPEDPFANYYFGRAFLKGAERIRSFSSETKAAYRQETEAVAGQIDRTCATIYAQKKHPDVSNEQLSVLTDLYQKLRLEQAKLYVFIWQLGGYEEDDDPDVYYRDKALDICESEALEAMKEAKALKAVIYTHVLDRWYWFEGQQIIQNRRWKRKDFQKKLDDLTRELKETEKL